MKSQNAINCALPVDSAVLVGWMGEELQVTPRGVGAAHRMSSLTPNDLLDALVAEIQDGGDVLHRQVALVGGTDFGVTLSA